jgi:hypothetical protein
MLLTGDTNRLMPRISIAFKNRSTKKPKNEATEFQKEIIMSYKKPSKFSYKTMT